jgi:CheY-like chemotaxis protein
MDTRATGSKNILLVEDDPQDAELTLAALGQHQLANSVTVVSDGEQALDYLYHRGEFEHRLGGNPILVLLDLKMPKVNGWEVLKAIKTDENLKLIPAVIFSSSREAPDLIECYKQGVNAYVVKPMDFQEFKQVVNQLGLFWGKINVLPPAPESAGIPAHNGHTALPASQPDRTNLVKPEGSRPAGYPVDSAIGGAAHEAALQTTGSDNT